MIHSLLFVLYFFAPVGLANMVPPILTKIRFLKQFDYPMDFHKQFRKNHFLVIIKHGVVLSVV